MGTGKTTVGRILAKRLEMEFLDMDNIIEERQGKAISNIFAEEGEPYFRSLERELTKELSQKKGLIIGSGGGIVLNPDNVKDFSRTGMVICLSADPMKILERVEMEAHRPLLEGDKKQKILRILESRCELYGAIPLQVNTTELSPTTVADRIVEMRPTL